MEELKIGIVAEGISDYRVIKHIIERFLKDKNLNIVSLQPKITPSGKQDGYGGWQKIFEYISQKEYIIDLAQTEDCALIIVQLDTDVCEQYGINVNTNHEILFNDIRAKIHEKAHPDFDKTKIIPAVCIHSLECWLIPFVSNDNTQCRKIDHCIRAINREIRTVGTIDENNKGAALHLYDFILGKKKKAKEIQEIAQQNFGFSKFIELLSTLNNEIQN